MFLSAFITGNLATKIKLSAKKSAQTAYRTKILLDTNQFLQHETEKSGIIRVTASQLTKLLSRDILFFTPDENSVLVPSYFQAEMNANGSVSSDASISTETSIQTDATAPTNASAPANSSAPANASAPTNTSARVTVPFSKNVFISENERAVAAWVFKNNKRAGATTDTLSNSSYLYLAVRVNAKVYGVVGIRILDEPIESFENTILLSILGECALALENEQVAREKAQAAVLAKNEQLRANLLRSISHDLRTPLTSISGNADMLLGGEQSLNAECRKRIYTDIYDDSMWLINLVENLLAVTKIEDGSMHLNLQPELIGDLVAEALLHLNRKSVDHHITVNPVDELLMVHVDARLIVQVIINLVDNAIKYTPENSDISITYYKKGINAVVEIADNGPGMTDNVKIHLFEMFYTANNQIGDSRRSLGLGLSLSRSILHAHNGEITVKDYQPHGTVFTFILPVKEVHVHDENAHTGSGR